MPHMPFELITFPGVGLCMRVANLLPSGELAQNSALGRGRVADMLDGL